MNINEVIANVATRFSGTPVSDHAPIHPNDHVNLGQSTNDVIPTAMKLAVFRALADTPDKLRQLADAFSEKKKEYAGLLRLGPVLNSRA